MNAATYEKWVLTIWFGTGGAGITRESSIMLMICHLMQFTKTSL